MNQNTINVVEATPSIVNALKLLKQRTPTINENSSTKPFGTNGGITFTPTIDETPEKITGPFDVLLIWQEENEEAVPYIQVLDSSKPTETYAGYVYYVNTILSVPPDVLAPSVGWLYLEIDLENNIYSYDIGNYVPTYPLSQKKWAYGLAQISYDNEIWTVRRVHLPGNIVMPTWPENGYNGYFKLSMSTKTREIDNPDYDPDDPESPEHIDETYYEAHHSGGRYAVNGELDALAAGDVTGDLTDSLQDIFIHYHANGGIEDETPTGTTIEIGTMSSNSLTDSYWLIGQMSITEIIQQSHGVPSLLWFGCREESEPAEVPQS